MVRNAGVSVSPAASVMPTAIAMLGPLVLYNPNSAKAIILREGKLGEYRLYPKALREWLWSWYTGADVACCLGDCN